MRAFLITTWLLLTGSASAQQGQILKQQRSANGEGYTVLRVWGTPAEMGHAHGFLLAKEVTTMLAEVKSKLGNLYASARLAMQTAVWKPADLEQELQGMVAGVKAASPGASLDVQDLKVVNTLGDWSYFACRSHSSWGTFSKAPTRTLSTRRLDYGTPVPSARHHVLVARAPADGSVRWVNLGWAGMATSVTGVNEYGTLASLHDYQSKMVVGAHLPRMVAVRLALTMVGSLPIDKHLDAVYTALQQQSVMTSTFLNYYVPEGHGGVITCLGGQPCHKKRVPQPAYHGGQVLITTNDETDGLTTPPGDNLMGPYYQAGGQKSIADHYGLMGHSGLHLLSVDYRGRGDMILWAEGRTSTGVTPTIKLSWSELFPGSTSAGEPAGDRIKADGPLAVAEASLASLEAGLPAGDAGGGQPPPPNDSGCSCRVQEKGDGALALWPALLCMLLLRRGRRRGVA